MSMRTFNLEIWGLEGVVNNHDDATVGLVGDFGHSLDVNHHHGWIGRRLQPDHPGVWEDGSRQLVLFFKQIHSNIFQSVYVICACFLSIGMSQTLF